MSSHLHKPAADAAAKAAAVATRAAMTVATAMLEIGGFMLDAQIKESLQQFALASSGAMVGGEIVSESPGLPTFKDVGSDAFTLCWAAVQVPLDKFKKPIYEIDAYEVQYRLGEKWLPGGEISVPGQDDIKAAVAAARKGKKKKSEKEEAGKAAAAALANVELEFTVGDLSPYSVYRAQVRAHVRGGGWSGWGAQAKVLTVAIEPGEPTLEEGKSQSTIHGTGCEVHWTTASDHGNAIDKYEIMYKLAGGSGSGAAQNDPSKKLGSMVVTSKRDVSGMHFSMKATITDMLPLCNYQVRVRAHNEAGWGKWSLALGISTPYQ